MKKTFNQFINEVMTSTSGGIAGMHQSIEPLDDLPQIGGREADRLAIKPRRKKKNESFAGCPVFTVSNDDYAKCMHGRMRYERWNKKLNMEDIDNQEIRSYAHRNPGKPIIVKDDKYGTMSYFVPPKQEVSESVELDENPAIGYLGIPFKSLAKAGVQAVANKGKEIVVNKAKEVAVDSAKHIGRSAWQGAKSFATSDTVKTAGIGAGTAIASRALEKESNTKKESVEVEEGVKTQQFLKKIKMRKFDRDERKRKKDSHKKIMKYQKMVGISGEVEYDGESLDEADNTAAVAKQVKQVAKKYTKGKVTVRSKGGKTRFIMLSADNIDNKLRKMMLDVAYPKANIRDKSNISYGNISDRIISASVEHWAKALGLKESVEMDEVYGAEFLSRTNKWEKEAKAKAKKKKKTPAVQKNIDEWEHHTTKIDR